MLEVDIGNNALELSTIRLLQIGDYQNMALCARRYLVESILCTPQV